MLWLCLRLCVYVVSVCLTDCIYYLCLCASELFYGHEAENNVNANTNVSSVELATLQQLEKIARSMNRNYEKWKIFLYISLNSI